MNLKKTDIFWMFPLALALGAALSSVQAGNWLVGFVLFSFLFLLSFVLLKILYGWATRAERSEPIGERSRSGGKTLAIIIALAFALRLIVGVSLYLGLPIYGHEDADDKAGYVFTDAHNRDDQSWELASSDRPVVSAFTDKFAYDQYGGLLAFNALVYRYLSPDAQRPLLLILLSSLIAALGIPFLWKAVEQIFGDKVAFASAWIFALYPESILLGASAMREPYLLTFSALALYGFVYGVSQLAGENGSKLAPNASKLAHHWHTRHVACLAADCDCHTHHLRGVDVLHERTQKSFVEGHSYLRGCFCPWVIISFRIAQPLGRIQCFVAAERGQRLVEAGGQMERVSDRTRVWLDTKALRRNARMDAPAVRRGLWRSATRPACHVGRPDKADLEGDLHFAVSGLVRDTSSVDHVVRSRGRTGVQKDAESHPVAFASRVDLGPACRTTRRRRPMG